MKGKPIYRFIERRCFCPGCITTETRKVRKLLNRKLKIRQNLWFEDMFQFQIRQMRLVREPLEISMGAEP